MILITIQRGTLGLTEGFVASFLSKFYLPVGQTAVALRPCKKLDS